MPAGFDDGKTRVVQPMGIKIPSLVGIPKNPADEALRYNDGKLPLAIVPPSLDAYVAAVMEFGARKYAMHNWRKGFPYTSILNSLKRHLAAFESGEDHDEETGLHHLAHVATNIAFLIEHIEQGYGTDDRLKLKSTRPRKLRKTENAAA